MKQPKLRPTSHNRCSPATAVRAERAKQTMATSRKATVKFSIRPYSRYRPFSQLRAGTIKRKG